MKIENVISVLREHMQSTQNDAWTRHFLRKSRSLSLLLLFMELTVAGGDELCVQEFKILNANYGEAEATGPTLRDL